MDPKEKSKLCFDLSLSTFSLGCVEGWIRTVLAQRGEEVVLNSRAQSSRDSAARFGEERSLSVEHHHPEKRLCIKTTTGDHAERLKHRHKRTS